MFWDTKVETIYKLQSSISSFVATVFEPPTVFEPQPIDFTVLFQIYVSTNKGMGF